MDSGTIKIFENAKFRSVWDDKSEEWYFSIVDVVAALTGLEYQCARSGSGAGAWHGCRN